MPPLLSSKSNSESEHLFQCQATYYNPVSCKWQEGIFTLYRNYCEFVAETPQHDAQFHLSLPFQMISAIKKRNSCLIYASLVVEVGSETHWFSSLPSRDSVYNLLELFRRNTLLAVQRNSNISEAINSETISPLGKKLLGILHESEETLVHTANMLDEQGQQLQEVEQYVEELNSDMTKAEKILHNLQLCSAASPTSPTDGSRGGEMEIELSGKKRKYKVTFTDSEKSQENTNEWQKGFLVLADGLKLVDQEENLIYHIPIAELLSIMIVSPWEMCVKWKSGEKTISYSVMCPMLSHFHKVVCSCPSLKEKISYKEECEDTFRKTSFSSVSSSSTSGSVSSPVKCDPEIVHLTEQVQKAQCSGTLTDEEVQQISTALSHLQTLATEVTKERECQLEKIKQLVDDVDKTDIRVNSDNRDLRKLL